MKVLVKAFGKSLCEDIVEILLKSSSRVHCIKILKMLCIGACMKVLLGIHKKFLYEDLASSSI